MLYKLKHSLRLSTTIIPNHLVTFLVPVVLSRNVLILELKQKVKKVKLPYTFGSFHGVLYLAFAMSAALGLLIIVPLFLSQYTLVLDR